MAEFDNMFLPGTGYSAGENFDFTNDFDAAPGTVSPSELMNTGDLYTMSNPASTAFPNLHTPDSSFLESPALASSGLNTSPMDNGLLDSSLNFSELESMAPLFPPETDQFANQLLDENKPVHNSSFTSINSARSSSSNASPMVRQKSSPGRPPAPYPANVPHVRKHSESSGISKSKASRKSLPEIEVKSEDDKETAKRKKNTAAARKSRLRKVELNEAMEAEINRLRGIIFRMGGDPDTD